MEDIFFSLVWFFISLLVSIVGVGLCKKLYTDVKNEEHQEKSKIIQRILKTYALVQCIGWPLLMSTSWLLYINRSHINALGLSYIQAGVMFIRILWRTLRNYIGFNSFIIALSRYLFIVKDDMVLKFGIRRIRHILLSSSMAMPIFLSLVGEATTPIEHAYFCVFVPKSINSYQYNNNTDSFCSQATVTKVFESPLYTFCWNYLPLAINYAIMMLRLILVIMVHSNLMEGIMYLHIFLFCWR